MSQDTLYVVLLLLAALASSGAAYVVWQRRQALGALPLWLLLVSLAIWSFTYAAYWLAADAGAGMRLFWLDATYLGVVTAPAAFFLFALAYTQRGHWITRRRLALLAIEPLLTLFLLWTDPLHGFFFAGLRTPDSSTIFEGGPWFWIHVIYSYGLLLITLLLLLHTYRRTQKAYRPQTRTVLLALTLPWISNIISLLDLNPLPGLDLTPLTFTAAALMLTYALFFQRLLDLAPVARDLIMERMREAVFIVDDRERIVDLNPAALSLLRTLHGQPLDECLGRSITEFFPDWAAWRDQDGESLEVEVLIEGQIRYYEPLLSPMISRDGRQQGLVIILSDITRRRQEQERLRLSEEKFAKAFQTAPYAILITRMRDGAIVEANDAFERMTGYRREEAVGHSSLELELWIDLEERDRLFAEMAMGRGVTNRELQFRRKNREVFTGLLSAQRFSVDGERYILSSVVDITERRQEQERLRLSEEKFAKAFQTAPYAVTIARVRDGAIVEVNDAFERITGYSREEALGRSSLELGLWIESEIRAQALRDMSQGKPLLNHELRFRRRNGEIFTGLLSAQLFTFNGESYILSNVADISERKAIEEALQASEARWRALLRAVPDLILRQHRDGTYLDYHANDPTLLAVSPEQFLGRNIREVFPAGDAERFIQWNDLALATGREVIREYTLEIGEELRFFEARIVASGPDEVVTLIRDITEREQARRREFEIALERERARVLTTFMQHASHEFRTPLTIINSSASLTALLEDPEARQQKAERIREQVRRITRLVDMILDMVRLESETPEFTLLDLTPMIRRVCEIMQERVQTMRIECLIDPDLPVVYASERLIHEALEMLLDNAQRYSPAGSTIRLLAGCDGDHLVISVQDEGPGIPEEEQKLIFETFWRKDKAHTTPGFGLGLTIARRIAELHKGELRLKSAVGQGSCFCLRLPVA